MVTLDNVAMARLYMDRIVFSTYDTIRAVLKNRMSQTLDMLMSMNKDDVYTICDFKDTKIEYAQPRKNEFIEVGVKMSMTLDDYHKKIINLTLHLKGKEEYECYIVLDFSVDNKGRWGIADTASLLAAITNSIGIKYTQWYHPDTLKSVFMGEDANLALLYAERAGSKVINKGEE